MNVNKLKTFEKVLLGVFFVLIVMTVYFTLTQSRTVEDSTTSSTTSELKVRDESSDVRPSVGGSAALQPGSVDSSVAVPNRGGCGVSQSQALQGAACLNPQDIR